MLFFTVSVSNAQYLMPYVYLVMILYWLRRVVFVLKFLIRTLQFLTRTLKFLTRTKSGIFILICNVYFFRPQVQLFNSWVLSSHRLFIIYIIPWFFRCLYYFINVMLLLDYCTLFPHVVNNLLEALAILSSV